MTKMSSALLMKFLETRIRVSLRLIIPVLLLYALARICSSRLLAFAPAGAMIDNKNTQLNERAIAEAERDDLLQKLLVLYPAMLGGICEIFLTRDLSVRVGFDQIDSAIFGQSIIEPRVTAQAQYAIDAL